MANPVTKIYELKTLSYNQVIDELNSINTAFDRIKRTKQELNNIKFSTDDADRLKEVNSQLKDEKIRTAELRLEKQKLVNEGKVLQNQKLQETTQTKASTAAIIAEAGSLQDLINKRRELQNLLSRRSPDTSSTIAFEGKNLSFEQANIRAQQLNASIAEMRARMNGVNDIGTRMNAALTAGFDRMKGSLSAMILTYTGWFAAFREAGQIIQQNVRLSDSFADLQIRIHGTGEDVEDLFESLKKIDTRTSLANLVDIANIVAKKGVPKEEIAALTAEFDKLNVVLGHEIGEPATATANIIKLITIFNDDKHVTAERVNEIGTALFKLTTTGVATGEFLVNFAERVGAVRGITGLTLPSVLGMGAALQQLGQRTEVAGTAAVQLTTRIFADIPKFARAAGKSIEDFRDLLSQDPFEALISVAEGLKNIEGEEFSQEFEEVVQAFQAVGVEGVRVKAVLGDIATNGQFVRDRMKTAQVSTEDYATAAESVELKQRTFAATLARVRKALEELGTSKAVQITLAAIASIILLVVQNLGAIITVIGIYAAAWAVANSSMIIARITAFALNAAFIAQYAALTIGQTFMRAYSAAVLFLTGATNGATTATRLLTIAMRLLPLGILITLIALLAAGCTTLKAKLEGTTDALRAQAEHQRILQEVNEQANASIAEQISQLETLVAVIKSTTTSYDTKMRALDELIAMNKNFSTVLKGNVIDLNALEAALKQTREEITLTAQAQASAQLAGEKYKTYLDNIATRQAVERKAAVAPKERFAFTQQIPSISLRDLKPDQRELAFAALPQPTSTAGGGNLLIDGILYNSETFFKNLQEEESRAYEDYKQYSDVSAGFKAKLLADQKKNADENKKNVALSREDFINQSLTLKLTRDDLQDVIKAVDAQLDLLKEGDPKIIELQNKRKIFKDRLDAINGKETAGGKPSRGARLTGEDRDALNIIEANMKEELAIEESRFAKLQLDHRATFQEEIDHIANMRDIQQRFIQQKVNYLESLDKLNAKEKERLSDAKKDLLDVELKAQRDIQVINDRNFDFQKANLQQILNNQIEQINAEVALVEANASVPNEAKARIRAEGNQRILALQLDFNQKIDELEKQLNQRSTANAREGAAAVSRTRQEIFEDATKILNAQLKDAQNAGDQIIAEFKQRAAQRTIEVLQSNRSPVEIARELKRIQDQLSRDLLAAQNAQLKIELDLYEQGKNSKIKSEKEYQEAKAKYLETEAKLTAQNINQQLTEYERFFQALKNFVKSAVENILGIKQYQKDAEGDAERYKDAQVQAEQTIQTAIREAYQGYFENRQARIDLERDVARERIDAEEEQVKARAQSQAEIDSIDKQYDERRKALDKKAAQEKKQLALKQLSIDFAVAVVKALAQYGLPLALIPIAAMTALFFIQRGNINSQQFEKGGIAPTKRGGLFRGPSHKDGGIRFEAEGDEAYIVNKRSATDKQKVHTISGTKAQIASAVNWLGGGVNFTPGAKVLFQQGGFLGSSYRAPAYVPSNSNSSDIEALRMEFVAYAEKVNEWASTLEVVQDTNSVTSAQRKIVKQNTIGILP